MKSKTRKNAPQSIAQPATGIGRYVTFWALSALFVAANPVYPPLNPPALKVESCQLPAPAEFTATSTGSTSIALNWSAVSGAEAYRLTVYDLSSMAIVISRVEHGTGASIYGLPSGVAYRCVLSSVCTSGTTSSFIITSDVMY
jgi:hypothetical protein